MSKSEKIMSRLIDWWNGIKINHSVITSGGRKYVITKKKSVLCSAVLQEYPNCCMIGIITNVVTYEPFAGLGFAQTMITTLIEEARRLEYKVIEATTTQESPEMHHILRKKGFVVDYEEVNIKTKNTVTKYRLTL